MPNKSIFTAPRYLTDGGLETTLIYHRGWELPHFAAFQLLRTAAGETALREYYRDYAELAKKYQTGLLLESATWRASADWGMRLGYSQDELDAANRQSIAMFADLRAEFATETLPVVVTGCIGPRGDGYQPGELMTIEQATAYHTRQCAVLADTAADLLAAYTINYVAEAIGITRAASAAGKPVAISFTVETDGRLPTGQKLGEAITQVDDVTDGYPAYYLINCAHPEHFEQQVLTGEPWVTRLRGLRVNSSLKSHAELNEATALDDGDPPALGAQCGKLARLLPNITILGGCCGTDARHVEQMAIAWVENSP
ncbi:MAG: homocysteine S-methyltransferase family protein [Pirellulales bacterium]|nr:homocysteine S-methyltransferase family protein [Pirellulales bacterium]